MGSKGYNFPYGNRYVDGRCFIETRNPKRPDEVDFGSRLLKSGEKQDCRSEDGIMDLVGNVEEWVFEDWAGSDGLLEGGAWNTFREHANCSGLAVRQPDYRINLERSFASAGFRSARLAVAGGPTMP